MMPVTVTTARKSLPLASLVALILCASSCGSQNQLEKKVPAIGWRPIGAWSGQGNQQTESFNIEGTQWRIRWEAKDEVAPGKGSLVIMVNSAVSGRPIALGVDHKGAGKGIAYVTEDPRLYELVIESSGEKWAFSVDEAVAEETAPKNAAAP